jgi:hypothetical protein
VNRAVPVVAAAVVAVSVIALREAAMSVHEETEAGSRTEIVLRGSSNSDDMPLEQRVQALFQVCQLEVHSVLEPDGFRRVDGDEFSFVVAPALDDSDERQLHGCLEDAVVDHVQARVLEMRVL